MKLVACLQKNLIAVVFILVTGRSVAQVDTVYIRTNTRTSVSVGKVNQEFSFGLIRMASRAGEKFNVTNTEGKFDVEIVAGKRWLIDLTVSPYRQLEIQKTSSDKSVSANELTRFFAAQNKKSTNLAFDYLETYKKGFFTTDALALINALNAEEQLKSLSDAMAKENYYLATDLALGLVNNPGTKYLGKSQLTQMNTLFTSVAAFLDNAGTLAINGGQYQKGIELYKKSNQLLPRNDLVERIAKTEKVDEQVRYSRLMNEADSLEKVNAFSETTRVLQRANEIRPDEAVSKRIERLDLQMQDSLYQKAVTTDKKEQFIFYRKKGYLTYLSRYPNGKYSENAEARVNRLNKDFHRVNKIGGFYGWGTVGFQGEKIAGNSYTSINNIGIVKLTETRFYGLDFSFNQDFFEMNKLSSSGDYKFFANFTDKMILTDDFNGQKYYSGAAVGTFSFGMLAYKVRSMKVFLGFSIGWGKLKTWVYGYRYDLLTATFPYSTAGQNAYYYKVDSDNVTTAFVPVSIIILGEFKGVVFKGSVSLGGHIMTNVSVGYAF